MNKIIPEQLLGLSEAEYTEIIRYVVGEFEEADAAHARLESDHKNLVQTHEQLAREHTDLTKRYQEQLNTIKESISQKLNTSHNISNSSVGAFEVVEEAVKELSIQHEQEIKSLRQAKEKEIQTITKSLVSHDNSHLFSQIAELEECLIELTKYMSRGDEFEVPGNTTELCSAAKQYIVSNHAVTISELDSKHMLELDECKVGYEEKLKDQEMSHAFSKGDLIAQYDQVVMDKDDSYQERLRSLDEKLYSLESELTIIKGNTSTEDKENIGMKSSSNEFEVHVTEHASADTAVDRYKDDKLPKKQIPRRSGLQRSQSLRYPKAQAQKSNLQRRQSLKLPKAQSQQSKLQRSQSLVTSQHSSTRRSGIPAPRSRMQQENPIMISEKDEHKQIHLKEPKTDPMPEKLDKRHDTGTQTVDIERHEVATEAVVLSRDECVQTQEGQGRRRSSKSRGELPEPTKNLEFRAQVAEITDLWNDLLLPDQSLNLTDFSIGALETSPVMESPVQLDQSYTRLFDEETGDIPPEFLTSPRDHVAQDDVITMARMTDRENNLLQNTRELFSGLLDTDMEESSKTNMETADLRRTGDSIVQRVESGGFAPEGGVSLADEIGVIDIFEDETEESVPVYVLLEVQALLQDREQEVEQLDAELVKLKEILFETEEQRSELRSALEQSRDESKRLNMLNMIHTDNNICRDASHPTIQDASCSPIAGPQHGEAARVDVGVNTSLVVEDGVENHPYKSNIASLIGRLNLEDTRAGSRTLGNDTLNETTGAPDLSLFDLTLTTGLSYTAGLSHTTGISYSSLSLPENHDQTALYDHLCDIQGEAMKIHDRSEDLCRDNDKLHKQVELLSKDLEMEKGKLKTKIKEVMEEREKVKRLDAQLIANTELHTKKVEELTKKLAHEESLRKKYHSTIKANRETHKKKLDEVFEFHQTETDKLTAKNKLTEEQAKGLAKLINVEPTKVVVSTDCQTNSSIFSDSGVPFSDDSKGSALEASELEQLKDQLSQVEEEYLLLMKHSRSVDENNKDLQDQLKSAEENFARQNEENHTLIAMTSKEKQDAEVELNRIQNTLNQSEVIISAVLPTFPAELPTMKIRERNSVIGDSDVSQRSNDTVNFTRLSSSDDPTSVLPDSARYLAGMFKTTTEQVQELHGALENKTGQFTSLVSTHNSLKKKLSGTETELRELKSKMSEVDIINDKLQDANRIIAKLKGEILKLSTEAQNAQNAGGNTMEDAMIEENEELKNKVEKLEEIKAALLSDVQNLQEQLEEEKDINEKASREMGEANEIIDQLRLQQAKLESDWQGSENKRSAMEEKVTALEREVAELLNQIKHEKEVTKELLEQAENASSTLTTNTKREMQELQSTTGDLHRCVEGLKAELRRKEAELEDMGDSNSTLQKKLNKLQPSLESYEQENLQLKEQLSSVQESMLLYKKQLNAAQETIDINKEQIDELAVKKSDLKESVNHTLKQKLKEAKDKNSEYECDLEERDRALRRMTSELHASKEELATKEEQVEKLEAAVEELKARVNIRKKSASSQAAVSRYDVGSSCTLLDSSTDPELQQHYDKLRGQVDQMTSELDAHKNTRSQLESQLQQFREGKITSDSLTLKKEQEHATALETLRTTYSQEKEAALEKRRSEHEAEKTKLEEKHLRELMAKELERDTMLGDKDAACKRLIAKKEAELEPLLEEKEVEHKLQMEKLIGDLEEKREQDYAMLTQRAGLEPESLTSSHTLLPGSSQLSDRIEALHNQAIEIRNLALAFYESGHPPTKEVSVQAITRMFNSATQMSSSIMENQEPTQNETQSMSDLIQVFKEAHEKQTEVLLKELKTDEKTATPTNDMELQREEFQRLRLSVETYTTRCAILEHNNRLLKDRNSGLENDLISTAAQGNRKKFFVEEESEQEEPDIYNSHVQRKEPRDFRKRLAGCQKEIGKLQDTVAEYQEAIELLEMELEREKEERKRSEKRMRAAESAVIEIKNDRLLDEHDNDNDLQTQLEQAKQSCFLVETENAHLKVNNRKLKNLNISLLEANKDGIQQQATEDNSDNLIREIDSLKELENVRCELLSKETESGHKDQTICLLENELESKKNMIVAQKDELESKDKVIRLIKSELSAQQMDIAQLKAMLDIEQTRCEELERRLKNSDLRKVDEATRDEIRRLRVDNVELKKECAGSPNSRTRVTKAYLKYLKAEAFRKSLVFQKQYLLGLIAKSRNVENVALSILQIKSDGKKTKKVTFKHAAVLIVSVIRMRFLVRKWAQVKTSLNEKQRNKQTPSVCHSSQLTEHRSLIIEQPVIQERPTLIQPLVFNRSPSPVPKLHISTSPHSGYPKWDSSRPVSPPSHPRDGLSARVYGSPSPDPSLSRLDQQLARLRQTINTRAAYNERCSQPDDHSPRVSEHSPRVSEHSPRVSEHSPRVSEHSPRVRSERVVPERDTGISKPNTNDDDGSGTLSDISNYISRLEAVQNRLTDLKLSSHKIYDSNKSAS